MERTYETAAALVGRCGLDMGCRADTAIAQEAQQLCDVAALLAPGLAADTFVSAPNPVLVALNVQFVEIRQHQTALCKPTVKTQCVLSFDINDAR